MEVTIMNYSALDKALVYLNDGIIDESFIMEMTDIELNSFEDIKAFNKELNKWKYGVLINGKVYTKSSEIDWSKYKTIPIELIDKHHVGICWDFVNYEYYYFNKNHIPTESYLFVMQKSDNPDDIVTHTFIIFRYEGKKYWFESSWFGHQGIHEVSGYKDVVKELVDKYGKHSYSVYKYDPKGMDKNITNGQFFKKATRNLVYNHEEKSVNESKDASELDSDFKKKSDLHFKILDMKSSSANKYVPKEWKDEFNYKAKDAAIAVCKEDDKLAGFIYWNPKSGAIGPLKVYSEYRGYGISELLLKTAIDGGGYKLGVYEDNKVAYNLYKKMGFKEVDRKEYADGDVAIMMELNKK
jgi:ribosomal protein S18 acetylase RimI-like enzyme